MTVCSFEQNSFFELDKTRILYNNKSRKETFFSRLFFLEVDMHIGDLLNEFVDLLTVINFLKFKKQDIPSTVQTRYENLYSSICSAHSKKGDK